jgi:hypothetical protein
MKIDTIKFESRKFKKNTPYVGVLCINNYKPRSKRLEIVNLPVGYLPGRRGKLSNWVGVWKVKYLNTKNYRKDLV